VKSAAGKSKTGMALSKPLQATPYIPGNIYLNFLYQKNLVFLGSEVKF
jgi:hypothetical protein